MPSQGRDGPPSDHFLALRFGAFARVISKTRPRSKLHRRINRGDVQFFELTRGDRSRALRHEILSFLRLWKSDYISDARGAAQQRNHAVQAERNAPVRRRTVRKRFEHVADTAFHDV